MPNLLVVSTALLGLYVLYYLVQVTRHELRIRKIGGVRAPRLATNPLTSALWFTNAARAQMRHRLLEFFDSCFAQANPAMGECVEIQVKPNERYILTRDPEHVKAILTTNFGSFGKGPSFNELWRPFLGDSIFTTDGQLWHDSRSLIRPMFIKDRVSDLAIFERWTSALVDKIPRDGTYVDIMDLFYRMTLDVTTDFLLGTSVNSLANPRNHFAEAFNDVQRIQMLLTTIGPFSDIVPRSTYRRHIATIDRFVVPFIDQALSLPMEELEKLTSSDRTFTFLHSIARYTRDPRVLRDQIVAVLLAGRDTTAATLSWALYELSRYPDKFQRLRSEVVDAVGRTRTPTYEDLKNMKYLRHVLDETLRLYPAVPYNLRSALRDTTIPGALGQLPISVVEGDIVVYSTLSMQRRPELYPPVSDKFADPAVFSPERWETWTPRAWLYVPFNGGPRICVGQNFALTEMSYCLVRVLQKFDRVEYCGDWDAQYHVPEVVGRPGQGVKVVMHEECERIAGDGGSPRPFA
ncbi:cytochrome P450 [Pseudomassariella vexata]|uniref:Cytochrome P450 n=1 Tax=Pseudomassariella vexata TaxID=1141098 RepID=A0A1Y2E883_9PEZI|nr:cytochrome P450 [Pseudomassariella vexata]ORY67749.1 cytochrome P450 [Pseudomassariella vexata]